jgi:DNA methylase
VRHRFHALCPYFTKPGEVVLDPFCGRGTTPLSAVLLGRVAIGCDVNDVAYCVSLAKTRAPVFARVVNRINDLEDRYEASKWRDAANACAPFFHRAYHLDTLPQLLYLRNEICWRKSRTDAMVASLVLGVLHGESNKSPSYLSNQMPRTISTKPDYSLRFWKKHRSFPPKRDVFALLRSRAEYRYESPRPRGRAIIIQRDMRELPLIIDSLPGPIKCVVTSPPYFDVTNFEEDQWLRIWFLGGPPRPQANRLSRDDRYRFEGHYWRFIADMWRTLGAIVGKGAKIVIRVGSSRIPSDSLQRQLVATSQFAKRRVRLVSTEISEIRRPQTLAFRPGAKGCAVEVDCQFVVRD